MFDGFAGNKHTKKSRLRTAAAWDPFHETARLFRLEFEEIAPAKSSMRPGEIEHHRILTLARKDLTNPPRTTRHFKACAVPNIDNA